MHKLSTSKKCILFITLLLALAYVTPVLADYLGPKRTVTTYVSYCRYVQKRCAQQKNGQWEWNTVEDWDCSHGDRGCSGGGGACNKDNDGARSCERDEGVREETVTYDPATIAGTVNCTLVNGWCNGGSVPELALSAYEPVAGHSILLIEGTLNSTSFACATGAINCNVPLGEGDNNFNYWALSSWGDSSLMGTSTARVDTVPPDVGLSITGTAGHNGWYRSAVQVSAAGSDATSGLATLEVAADGGAYQAYTTAIPFTDGRHTLQFKAVDNAGNLFEAPAQNFLVDTIPPTVDVPAAWKLGRDVDYTVRDEGSGLAALRIVIEDEDEKYAKMVWDRDASGVTYSSHIDWNGQFRDNTVAPPGTYLVWFKARDMAGNERFQMAKVIVPEPNVALSVLPTADPAIATVPPVPPAELSDAQPVPPITAASAVEGAAAGPGETTTHTVLLTSGTAGAAASTTTTSGILWGSAAAAVIAAATTYALEATRKRLEAEEAQAAAVRAQVAHDKAERAEKLQKQKDNQEKQKALQAAIDAYHEQKAREAHYERMAEKLTKLEEQENANWEAAQAAKKQQEQAAANQRITDKMTKFEEQEEAAWVAAQAAIKKKQEDKKAAEAAAKNAEKLAGLPGYSSEKQAVVAPPAPKQSWWQLNVTAPLQALWGPAKPPTEPPPTATKTITPTFTPSPTMTITRTPTATFTPTFTPTATATNTPTPTATPWQHKPSLWDRWFPPSPVAELPWNPNWRPLESFHQWQKNEPKTGDVGCVTTTAVIARNIMNEYLSHTSTETPERYLKVERYVKESDKLGDDQWDFRVPSNAKPVNIPGGDPQPIAGWMHPRVQLPDALDRFKNELKDRYGYSFNVKQTSWNDYTDIAGEVRDGNLVLISGMYPPEPGNQSILGGAPHTLGPVVKMDANTITLIDPGYPSGDPKAIHTFTKDEFLDFWGRSSKIEVQAGPDWLPDFLKPKVSVYAYTKPNTMTVLEPDVTAPGLTTSTPTPTTTPTATSTSTQTPTMTPSQTNTPVPTQTSTSTNTPSVTSTPPAPNTPTSTPTP